MTRVVEQDRKEGREWINLPMTKENKGIVKVPVELPSPVQKVGSDAE